MDAIAELVVEHPAHFIGGAALVIMVVYGIAKKLFQLALLATLVLGGYVLFAHVGGSDVPTARKLANQLRKESNGAKRKLKAVGTDARKHIDQVLRDVTQSEVNGKNRLKHKPRDRGAGP